MKLAPKRKMGIFLLVEFLCGAGIAAVFFTDGGYGGGSLVLLTMLLTIGLGILGTSKANQAVMYLVSNIFLANS